MKFVLGKADFGKVWQEKPLDWYYDLWNKLPLLHKNFHDTVRAAMTVPRSTIREKWTVAKHLEILPFPPK